MLIDTGMTIAYKCSSCGSFEFYAASLFALLIGKETRFGCHCGESELVIHAAGDGYQIKMPCIGCGSEHVYTVDRKNMIKKGIVVLSCPETDLPLCFIGKDDPVRKKVDHMEKELDELIDMFGYESYFSNTRVMLDSLNKIHDIAEQGNLYCECGNTDIELLLLPDTILLKCRRCFAEASVPASSNRDLRETLQKRHILIASGSQESSERRVDRLIRKTDGK